jgi:S1-C subfamily serine protease
VLASAEGSAVRIDRVVAGSIAESAGLRSGDVLLSVAGGAVKTVSDVQRAVHRQAPGTWLPLRVSRDGGELELVAKFPPE